MNSSAPWFFRQRASIFGALYGIAFFAGYPVAQLLGRPLVPLARAPAVALAAAVLVLAGYALRVWASSYLAASIVWTQEIQLGALQIDGPYRFTRNPLYLGNVLQAVGIGMLGPWPVMLLAVTFNAAYCVVLIAVEERYLTERNGSAYAAYLASVPRFVPMPGRAAPSAGNPGSLPAGIRSESIIGLSTLAILVAIAWTALR